MQEIEQVASIGAGTLTGAGGEGTLSGAGGRSVGGGGSAVLGTAGAGPTAGSGGTYDDGCRGPMPAYPLPANIVIMLDESLTSVADAQAAIAAETCDLFNIRLSKCGGFLNSLRLAAMARSADLGYQLGCHPGESGILSAAGRHWACSVAYIRYLEGSYDRYLFHRLLTNEDITFGYGGLAPAIDKPGLGVTINEAVLREQTLAWQEFAVT
jgi:hypothetical protein